MIVCVSLVNSMLKNQSRLMALRWCLKRHHPFNLKRKTERHSYLKREFHLLNYKDLRRRRGEFTFDSYITLYFGLPKYQTIHVLLTILLPFYPQLWIMN